MTNTMCTNLVKSKKGNLYHYYKEYSAQYYIRNKEKRRLQLKNYYQENKVSKIHPRNKKRWDKRKLYLMNFKGGKCWKCGMIFPSVCYDFHHLDPKTKKQKTLNLNRSLEYLEKEMENCVMVCANCHRVIHLGGVE